MSISLKLDWNWLESIAWELSSACHEKVNPHTTMEDCSEVSHNMPGDALDVCFSNI